MPTLVDRIQGLSGSLAFKPPVRVATTANIVLNGLGTVDGVALAAGDRVLVRAQTDTTENGIYGANTSDWSRSLDFNGANDMTKGTLVLVTDGTAYGMTTWHVSTTSPAIGSALAFTLAKRRESVSVKDFGAVGDGVTDDTAAIQAAVDSLDTSFGGEIHFPRGDYLVSDTLSVSGNRVKLSGEGFGSRLMSSVTNKDAISVGNGTTYLWHFNMEDMHIQMTAASVTAGSVISIDGGIRGGLRNIYIDDGFIGITLKGTGQFNLDNIHVLYEQDNGGVTSGRKFMHILATSIAAIGSKHPGDVFITNFNGRCGATPYCDIGLEINAGDGIWINNFHLGNCITNHAKINANSSIKCTGILMHMGWFDQTDTATTGLLITGTTPTTVGNYHIKDCKFLASNSGSHGIDIGGKASNVYIQDTEVSNWGDTGIFIRNTFTGSGTIDGCRIRDCSQNTSGAANGISYVNSDTAWVIQNNIISGTRHNSHITITGLKATAHINNNVLIGSTVGAAMDPLLGTDISQMNNIGFNPVGAVTTAAGVSPWTYTNPKPYPVQIHIHGGGAGTITDIRKNATDINGRDDGYDFTLGIGESVTVTYTGSIYAYMFGL